MSITERQHYSSCFTYSLYNVTWGSSSYNYLIIELGHYQSIYCISKCKWVLLHLFFKGENEYMKLSSGPKSQTQSLTYSKHTLAAA